MEEFQRQEGGVARGWDAKVDRLQPVGRRQLEAARQHRLVLAGQGVEDLEAGQVLAHADVLGGDGGVGGAAERASCAVYTGACVAHFTLEQLPLALNGDVASCLDQRRCATGGRRCSCWRASACGSRRFGRRPRRGSRPPPRRGCSRPPPASAVGEEDGDAVAGRTLAAVHLRGVAGDDVDEVVGADAVAGRPQRVLVPHHAVYWGCHEWKVSALLYAISPKIPTSQRPSARGPCGVAHGSRSKTNMKSRSPSPASGGAPNSCTIIVLRPGGAPRPRAVGGPAARAARVLRADAQGAPRRVGFIGVVSSARWSGRACSPRTRGRRHRAAATRRT